MATTPTPEYKGSLVLNEVDSFETYQEMLNKGLASENNNEFYLLPDEDEYISYDPYPVEGSTNLVTSGGIYSSFKASIEESNAALIEAISRYESLNEDLEKAIDAAVQSILNEIDLSIMTADDVDTFIAEAEEELINEEGAS